MGETIEKQNRSLPGLKIKVPKPALQPEVTTPPKVVNKPEVVENQFNFHEEDQDETENDSNSILAQHFKSAKTQENIEALPKKSPLKLKISLSTSSNSKSSSKTLPLAIQPAKKVKKFKKKLPKISILPPKQPAELKPPILGAFVTKSNNSLSFSRGQEIHHKRKKPAHSPISEVPPNLKVPKLVIKTDRLKKFYKIPS